ncbi:ubiquitin carboxyl-terminal hydrolase 45-like [Microtus ochrogaster]|uniref:Ubiquitin carboxyl-terminal hydrolase 45-like n=1 Tax=Microtus ochrogaster TaxID=79684 RepID=A0ABM1UKU7_MICOH|nr:ubiquitin carboxyl-terminal hydrolase 45-like [Microtus ochrogaster]
MRVKDPSKDLPEKGKRNKRALLPHDEDSSDDIAVRDFTTLVLFPCSVPLGWRSGKYVFGGCGRNSQSQHSLRHFKSSGTESHCVVINLSTWIIWCYECNEKLSTQCNKKVLAQIVDFLQKHVSKTQTGAFSRIIKLCEEKRETGEIKKGRKGSCVPSVKGITNLGNTCFFNAVIQDPLVVELSSPGPLTSALFLFLHSMKEAEKGPLSPKVLFNQLCQK